MTLIAAMAIRRHAIIATIFKAITRTEIVRLLSPYDDSAVAQELGQGAANGSSVSVPVTPTSRPHPPAKSTSVAVNSSFANYIRVQALTAAGFTNAPRTR